MVKQERLNRVEAPCNPAPDYSFTSCLLESKARSVNCTMPWAKEIPGMSWTWTLDKKHAISNLSGLGVCSTMDQFDNFEAISAKIVRGDKKFIKDFTGCLFPCTYLEYNVVEEQLLRGRHGLGIYYGSVAVTVKTEVSGLIALPRYQDTK